MRIVDDRELIFSEIFAYHDLCFDARDAAGQRVDASDFFKFRICFLVDEPCGGRARSSSCVRSYSTSKGHSLPTLTAFREGFNVLISHLRIGCLQFRDPLPQRLRPLQRLILRGEDCYVLKELLACAIDPCVSNP